MDNNVINNTENSPALQQNNNVLNPPGAYFVPYTSPLKKEYIPLTKKENRFIFIVLIGLFLAVDFTLFHGFSLGFTIAYAAVFAISSAFIYDKDAKGKVFSITCGALSLILSVANSLFNNSFLKPVSVLVVLFLFAVYCLGISGNMPRISGSYKMLLELIKRTIIAPFDKLSEVFGSIKEGAKSNKKGIEIIIGIIVALPVLIVVIPLLVSGDAAFEGLVDKIINNIGIYLFEIVISLILLPFFYTYLFDKVRKNEEKKQIKTSTKSIPVSICTSFLSVISLTYIVYLFSQLAYFFSAFKGILPADYTNTASAFARRGFYEMFAISVINLAVISVISIFASRKNKKLPAVIKALSSFISLFSVLLLVIAMQKMRLNIATYGLSVNRILVCAFMLMMLVVIAFFILHIFAPKVKYMQPIIIICSIIFIALTFSDIDRIAADYNIEAYTSGKLEKLDVEAIAWMSDSAVPSLVGLTESKEGQIAVKAKEELADRMFYRTYFYTTYDGTKLISEDENNDFRAYNRAEQRANKAMKDYYESLSDKEKKELIKKYDL